MTDKKQIERQRAGLEVFGVDFGQPLRLGTPVTVVFGTPVAPKDFDDPNAGKERYQLASQRIFARIAELRPPQYAVI